MLLYSPFDLLFVCSIVTVVTICLALILKYVGNCELPVTYPSIILFLASMLFVVGFSVLLTSMLGFHLMFPECQETCYSTPTQFDDLNTPINIQYAKWGIVAGFLLLMVFVWTKLRSEPS